MLANDRSFSDSLATGLQTGYAGAVDGAIGGLVGGVASKALMQGAWAVNKDLSITGTFNKVTGAEGEFMAQNQSGNSKATYETPTGKQPDFWGDALPWAEPVYGDVKNTGRIPGMGAQKGQLQKILNAIPNRYDPQTNPTGNRMTIFYRPGVALPGARHSMAPHLASGAIQLVETTQYVFAPPETAGQLC
jgi:hypothetical protein